MLKQRNIKHFTGNILHNFIIFFTMHINGSSCMKMYIAADFILARGIIIFWGPCQHQIMALDNMMEALLYFTHFYICCIWYLSIYSFTFYFFLWISWMIIFWKCHMSHIKETDSFIKSVVTQTLTPQSQKTQFHESITQHAQGLPGYSRPICFHILVNDQTIFPS